jgi:DNA-damage-inducible protein D
MEITDSNTPSIQALVSAFEGARQEENGVEFWFARDLCGLLGYEKWENFSKVINKAEAACIVSGHSVEDHFPDVRKMVDIGSDASRSVNDIKLTRYACYLVAQNGDSRKQPIAFAQTYFAIQTRRQELSDADAPSLSEVEKRIFLRDEIKKHNKHLASAAKDVGVIQPLDYAIFQNHGYQGLYGGLNRSGIQNAKVLKPKQDILDHMGSTELAANFFRVTQTEEKLRREKQSITSKAQANKTHYDVGKKVRQTIQELDGTMPEALPVAEDINKLKPVALRKT